MINILNNYSAILLDVRSRQEFKEGHIDGAINIPLCDVKKEVPKRITDKNKYIIVYCTSGIRSKKAQKILNSMGYKNVYNLISGFKG
ncbi:MAG: rhodanese-like domain-containing protein [Clostridia bacterium]|nr:rhodanese-like domain-containing protein [Clostridia bacterium]